MELSNVSYSNTVASAYSSNSPAAVKAEDKKEEPVAKKAEEVAAVFEKSSDSDNKVTTKNKKMTEAQREALVTQMKADQERMQAQMLEIVQKTISKQGQTFSIATSDDMWKTLASGDFEADADTIAKAKEDIAEDGYWGVEQTSSRIVDFAIALSGDDTSKAELMINAFKKGFEQATGIWGKDLPDISSKTYDAVMNKFDQWKTGTYNISQSVEE